MKAPMKLATLVCALSASASLAAPQIVSTIHESALARFTSALPSLSGSLGPYQVTAQSPCPTLQNPFRTCTVVLFSGYVSWSGSSPRFTITPKGIKLSISVSASFNGASFSSTAEANVAISASANRIMLASQSVSVPLTFSLPGYGTWSPGSLTVPLDSAFRFELPLQQTVIEVPKADGGTRNVTFRTASVQATPQYGSLVITSEHTSW